MSQLFDDSDSEVELKTTNEYAKNYDTWRKKEELHKVKTKYGDIDLNEDDFNSTSSSEDDDDAAELTEEVEKDFYVTLALLKKKDPKIYDENNIFFTKSTEGERVTENKKSKKSKSLNIRDYERKILLEKGGVVSDEEDIEDKPKSLSYVDELRKLQDSLKKVAHDDDSDNEEWGGMLKARNNKQEKEKQDQEYKKWLAGQQELEDQDTKNSLKPLKDYWENPNLESGENFLKDYILNKRYLDKDNENHIPTYDEIVHDSDDNLSEDENAIEKQEEFEHKYNFRFEDPDQEFIKRYPRTLQSNLRKEDNRRKIKRVETRERKAKEKLEKMAELKKLRDLKRKEIEEKIEKLKEITGNNDMAFNDEDIEGDFDPEAHDKRMQALFNDDYYGGEEEDQKPKFDMDDEDCLELETENFDNWTSSSNAVEIANNEPHCEDDGFIMDADYDPKAATQKELIENTKRKRKRGRKSKFVEMLAQERPPFDTTDKTYEEYIDEYYKLDCEDIIDNIPCRFKYRKVPPNSFGLTIEEILSAKDRELNRWCSLKKAVQIRPEHVEKYDQIAFLKKGQNAALKKKILPSLYEPDEEDQDATISSDEMKLTTESTNNENESGGTNNTRKRKMDSEKSDTKLKKSKNNQESTNDENVIETNELTDTKNKKKRKMVSVNSDVNPKKSKKNAESTNNENAIEINKSSGVKNKKKRKMDSVKSNVKPKIYTESNNNENLTKTNESNNSIKLKMDSENSNVKQKSKKVVRKLKKEKLKNKNKGKPSKKLNTDIGLSDARLAAYGINPKKFKNKRIYGKTKGKKTS